MRSVNQATQDAWSEISYTKVRVYLPQLNMNIPVGNIASISLHEAISDIDNLLFVGCIASELNLTLNDFNTDIHLESVQMFVQKGNTTESKVFTGKIYTADYDGRTNSMKVVAYDDLYRVFNKDVTDWYENLTFPMTFKAFRDSFFTYCGLTQQTTTLPMDAITVNESIGGEVILGRDIIKPICEANVVFGHINYEGTFEYLSITNNNREIDLTEVSDMVTADYTTSQINKVIVRTDEEDIGAVSGSGSNAYIIEGNMFFLGMNAITLQTVADTIYSILSGFQFKPCESEEMYNFIYELGDLITVPDGFGNEVETIILDRTTDFQRETNISRGLKEYSEAASYTNTSLVALLGKTNRLHRDIEETRSTITDVAAGLQSEITQTAEGLEIQIQNLQSQIDGEIEYFETSTTPTLTNYPAYDFTKSIPFDGTIQFDDIYNEDMSVGGNQYPHFTYTDEDYQEHLRDLVFDKTNAVSYRFNYQKDEEGNKTWYWQEIADSETAYILQQISDLRVTAEELSSDMTSVEATISSQGLQIATNTSNITQTANAISSEVTRATNAEGTLSSRITQNATDISAKVSAERTNSSFGWHLKNDKFELKSNNQVVFKCDSSGIEVKGNATFTGTITGSYISGSTIDGITIKGAWTMATGASFGSLVVNGNGSISGSLSAGSLTLGNSSVNQTLAATYYGFSSSPSMKYSSELNGYVPVFSSAFAYAQFKGVPYTSSQSRFLTLT